MKASNLIATADLELPHKTKNNTWVQAFSEYLPDVIEVVERRVDGPEERVTLNDDLCTALGRLVRFEYLAKGERDRALAAGYQRFPKGQFNSAEQEAQARNFASEEVRLRDLIEQLIDAVKMRHSGSQSSLKFASNTIQAGG